MYGKDAVLCSARQCEPWSTSLSSNGYPYIYSQDLHFHTHYSCALGELLHLHNPGLEYEA
eukprot:00571_1